MKIRIDTAGFRRVLAQEPGRVATWLDGVAEQMITEMRLSMGTSPAGRRYERGRGRTHVASQPGYPPNVDTGTLRASLRWVRDGQFKRILTDGVEYGLALEDGVGMKPRPWMRPVFDKWRREIETDARMRLRIE